MIHQARLLCCQNAVFAFCVFARGPNGKQCEMTVQQQYKEGESPQSEEDGIEKNKPSLVAQICIVILDFSLISALFCFPGLQTAGEMKPCEKVTGEKSL